jgi:hypothetical protein
MNSWAGFDTRAGHLAENPQRSEEETHKLPQWVRLPLSVLIGQ